MTKVGGLSAQRANQVILFQNKITNLNVNIESYHLDSIVPETKKPMVHTGVLPVPCSNKIEKEKREHAKQHGMIRTEISGGEIAEEMEKERQAFQLQMCEVRGVVHLSTSCGRL